MSRTCIYCGRELEKAEKCNCPQSIRIRQEKNNTSQKTNTNTSYTTEQTNYTEPKKSKQKTDYKKLFDKFKLPKRNHTYNPKSQNFFKKLFVYIGLFFKSPVYTARNTGFVSRSIVISLIVIQGIVLSLIGFFSTGKMGRGIFSIASNVFGFRGVSGWKNVGNMLVSTVLGTSGFIIQFLLLVGIFYLLNKFILKQRSTFWDFVTIFAICAIPLIALGLFGIIFSIFSISTLLALIISGLIVEIILIYESLSTKWAIAPDKLIYFIAGGFFVYLSICYNIIRLFFI